MGRMKLVLSFSLFIYISLACSNTIEKTTVASSSIGSEKNSETMLGVDGEEFDESSQEPVMITGASLSCVSFKNRLVCKTNISNKIINEYSIMDSDIEVRNLQGEILQKNVTVLENNIILMAMKIMALQIFVL